jgi:hypothetical protein
MTPRWLDEHGNPMATRPCDRCVTPVPIGRTFRLEHTRMIGWQLFTEAQIVQWCGHAQHVRGLLRAELRRCGLRPPTPPGPGVWRWCAERDEWVTLMEPAPAHRT